MSDGTILQYARRHGLAIDHQANSSTFEFETLIQYASNISDHHETIPLRDIQEDIARCIPEISCVLTEPRLKLTIHESNLLSSAIAKPILDIPFPSSSWQSHLPNHRFKCELKLREPLLFINSGDLYKDLRGVRKGINLGSVLQDVRDQWKVDNGGEYKEITSDNESSIHELLDASDLLHNELKVEKIQVTREALCLLGEAMNCKDMQECLPNLYYEQVACERRKRFTKLPIMLSAHDFDSAMDGGHSFEDTEASGKEPLVDLNNLSLRSESSMHEINLPTTVTEEMETEDQLTRDSEYDQDLIDAAIGVPSPKMEEKYMNNSRDSHTTTQEPARKRRKIAQNLKLLVPLSMSPSPKEEHITTEGSDLENFGIASDIGSLLDIEGYDNDDFVLTQGTADSFDQELIKLSDEAATKVVNIPVSASMSPVVALTKVKVPDLPPDCPRVELYDMRGKDLISEFLDERVEILPFDQRQEIALNWIPFAIPSLSETTEESFNEASEYLSKAITQPQRIARSDQLLWKEDGLRILRDCERDEEELELASESEDCISANGNVEEDNQEIDIRALRQTSSTKPTEHPHISNQALKSANELSEKLRADKNPLLHDLAAASMGRLLSNARFPYADTRGFSASSSLSSFLDLRGRRFVRPKNVVDHIARESSEDPIQLTQDSASVAGKDWADGVINITKGPSAHNDSLPSNPHMFLPSATLLDGPRTIVVSNTLLQSHPTLVTYLERQGGSNLTILYRDLDPKYENCPDLILNPKTAVMYTNTQLLGQRPLPGQDKLGVLSPVHYSTSKLAAGFDNVIVMLMHNSPPAEKLSSTDSLLVSGYIAFCDLLSVSGGRVRVLWLKYGHSSFLTELINTWTWLCVVQYGLSDPALIDDSQLAVNHDSFIQDETLWELFLRRAGMNTLGASFVLGALKKSEDYLRNHNDCSKGGDVVQSWGLSCFVAMKSEDRLRLFSDVLGRRTVSIINDRIDCYIQES